VYKKRWYDGLNDIYEGKDEFEIKFGCFGGDGGGESSGPTAQDPNDVQNSPSPTTGFRGEQSAASPSNQGYSGPTGVGIGPSSTGTTSGNQTAGMSTEQAQANQNIAENIATAISANQAINNPLGSIDAFTGTPSAPSVSQNVSAVSNAPSVTGLSGYSGLSGYNSNIGVNAPTDVNTGTPTSTQDVVSDALSGLNVGKVGGFDVTAGKVGTGYGLTGTLSFAKGGAVNQGIGSVFPYPRRR
jgi:hypothetical protein